MPLDDFFYDYLRPSAPPRYVGTAARFGNLGLRQSASLITFRKAMTDPVNGGQEALAEGQKQQLLREPTPVCPTTDGAWSPPSQSAWDTDFLLDQVVVPHGDLDLRGYWERYLAAELGHPFQPLQIYSVGAVMSVSRDQVSR